MRAGKDVNRQWEVVEDTLSGGRTTCCAWNRRGTMLACGTASGSIVIWCWDVRAVTREFSRSDETDEEDAATLSVQWSGDGRKIVAAKSDGKVEVWDVLEEDVRAVLSNVGLCSSVGFSAARPKGDTLVISPSVQRAPYVRGTSLRGQKEMEMPSPHDAPIPGFAVCSKNGKYIFVGDAKGLVSVVDAEATRLVRSFDVPNATMVKRLELCRNGKHLLAVTNAQTLYGFDVDDAATEASEVLRPAREYASPWASRLQWGAAAYPWNGEFVYGVSSGAPHEIHVWDRASGELKCVLEGPAEAKGVTQLAAHPIRDCAIALGSNGYMYVWSRKHVEDWSAFDPSFVTLVDNNEYVEAEDEFDAKPPGEKQTRRGQIPVERLDPDDAPDLFTGSPNDFYTDNSDDDVLHALPIRIKPDPAAEKFAAERRAKWDRKAKRREERKRAEEEASKKVKESENKDVAEKTMETKAG